jgi:hypothetical protein
VGVVVTVMQMQVLVGFALGVFVGPEDSFTANPSEQLVARDQLRNRFRLGHYLSTVTFPMVEGIRRP